MEITRKIEDSLLQSHTALSQEDERNHSFITPKPDGAMHLSGLQSKPLMPINDAELRSRVQWKHATSPHFALSYDTASFESKEVDVLLYQLESMYHNTFHQIHETFPDRLVVYAVGLRSPSLLGRTSRTHFNVSERSLYVVRSAGEPIESELLIAITHAMRFGRYLSHYGITRGWAMLEDGFAVFLSERLRGEKHTFPFYGADSDLVAHYLKETQVVRLLSHVWSARGFATSLERYAIAGAFLLYLGDVMGDEKIVAFSRHDEAVTSDTFYMYFGASLDELEKRWTEHLPRTLNAYTEDERNEMVLQWLRCSHGKF